MIHNCPDCGLVHDAAATQVNPDVEIARIRAEAEVKIAQLNARQDAAWNESRVEVAEVEAESAVAVAEAEALVLGAVLSADPVVEQVDDPPPVVVSTPIVDSGNDVDETEPPKRDESEHESDEVPKAKRGLGLW